MHLQGEQELPHVRTKTPGDRLPMFLVVKSGHSLTKLKDLVFEIAYLRADLRDVASDYALDFFPPFTLYDVLQLNIAPERVKGFETTAVRY
jgi:hypothetical protein